MWQRIAVGLLVALTLGACVQPGTGMYRPDLTDDIVEYVSRGQSGQEVVALLGMPYQRIRFDNLKSTAWDYRYKDTWGYWVDLSIMMSDDGRVREKIKVRLEPVDQR